MGAIFLSYAREDRSCAERLARVLEQAGHDVWWDRHIDGGEEFASEIEAALDKADAVLVAWSQDSIKSRWVRDEASVGGDSNRLVPVSIDGSRPPMGFRQFHTLDLTGWKAGRSDKRTDELLRSVERRLHEAEGRPRETQPVTRPTSRAPRRAWIVAALLVPLLAVLGYFLFQKFAARPAGTPSVAVLPFSADSSDADARKLAAASRDAVAHTLSQGAFAVSTIEAAQKDGRAATDFLISGQVATTPDKVVANVRMEDTDHHLVVFSHQFEAPRDEAWTLPERVGAQVASQLSWTAPMIAMERRHPSDPAILGALLQSSTAGLEGTAVLSDYERARTLAAKAPESPLAQDNFAFSTAFALSQIPRAERPSAVAAARLANDRTVELAPEYNGGYIAWCLLRSEVRILECENHLRAGMRADPDGAFANFFLAGALNGVGRTREALELARVSLAHDPYMPFKIAMALRALEANGQTQEADELYRKSTRWWPGNGPIFHFRISGMIQRGDFAAALKFSKEADPKAPVSPVLGALATRASASIKKACGRTDLQNIEPILCMLGLAQIGERDAAFALADRFYPSRQGRTPAEEDRLWLDDPDRYPTSFLAAPSAAPMRQDPRYIAVAQRTGLLQYWRSGRMPDFCRTPGEPVCARLKPVR